MRLEAKVKMADVLEKEEDVDAEVILSIGESDDGVVVKDSQGRTRVIVENHEGMLTAYVWEDPIWAEQAGEPRIFDLFM